MDSESIAMLPKTWVEVSEEVWNQNMGLIEALEELDDVEEVYHNMKME